MRAALAGRTTFMKSWVSQFQKRLEIDEEYRYRIAYRIPGKYCTQTESCRESLANVLGELTGLAVGVAPVRIPLKPREIWYEGWMPDPEDSLPEPFCDACRQILQESFYRSQEDWWKSLPGCFLLPSWTKLQDFDQGKYDKLSNE